MDSGIDAPPALLMQGITVRYPGVLALDRVDFKMQAGEVHALMGENGAGKSTLLKVLTGAQPAHSGIISLNGVSICPRTPLEAQKLGIGSVYQEVNLIPSLSVGENIMLGSQPMRLGSIDWSDLHRVAARALDRLALNLDTRRPLGSCSIAAQQLVAIARALEQTREVTNARLLVLDEPTSSLDAEEVERLFRVIEQLKRDGLAILFVSHFLDQVFRISQRITVLRNGALVGEYETKSLSRVELVEKMLGRRVGQRDSTSGAKRSENVSKPALVASGLTSKVVGPVELSVRPGEVLGVAGLLGSGRSELAKLLFGLDCASAGHIAIAGKKRKISSPKSAMNNGVGFLPEDRKVEGIFPNLSVRDNILLALQVRNGWLRRISKRSQDAICKKYIEALNIRTPSPDTPAGRLSGGSQQKVLIARWLAAQPKVLILDEPTRGVDVGAKAEIEALMAKLGNEGLAIVLIGTDVEEVARDSHRVVLMRDRKMVGKLVGDEVRVANIIRIIAAGSHADA